MSRAKIMPVHQEILDEISRNGRMTALKDWCRPWSFWKCEFKDYARWVRLKKQERSIEKIEPLEAYV